MFLPRLKSKVCLSFSYKIVFSTITFIKKDSKSSSSVALTLLPGLERIISEFLPAGYLPSKEVIMKLSEEMYLGRWKIRLRG
jgi:hypothetical protein